jgi:hypothetical protein
VRYALVEGKSGPYIATPALQLQPLPLWLDVRWIMPVLEASIAVAGVTVLAWPFATLWRRWRKRRFSEALIDRRLYHAIRLVLLVDLGVLLGAAVLFALTTADLTLLTAKLDPVFLALYTAAWIGVIGAPLVAWAAVRFWRNGAGGHWVRIHHTLLAASSVMIAWFFMMFRLAGTTLNY